MARQTGDDLSGLPLPVSRSSFLLCVVCVLYHTLLNVFVSTDVDTYM